MIKNQLIIFMIFAMSGIIMSIIFDFFRATRKNIKPSILLTYIEDCLFWIISGTILIFEIIKFSQGEVRLYLFIGLILGSVFYFAIFSKYILKIFTMILSFFINIGQRIKKFIIKNVINSLKIRKQKIVKKLVKRKSKEKLLSKIK